MAVAPAVISATLAALVCLCVPPFLSPKLPPVWEGSVHTDFTRVRDVFRQAVEDGRLQGGSIAAYYKGELIVDLWGGYADLEAQRPWSGVTMTTIYSTSKLLAAVVVAQMVERGVLDYGRPVADYWPEFAQQGKGNITVEMLLSHQAGLVLLDDGIYIRDLVDKPEDFEQHVARQKPRDQAGGVFGYHGLTFGLYVDTLVRKADPRHRNMSEIIREELAHPLDIDVYLGLPKSLFHRLARVYPLSLVQFIWRSFTSGDLADLWGLYISFPVSGSDWSALIGTIKDMATTHSMVNDPGKAEVGMSSYSGQATARGLAKLCSVLATGGSYKGRQLLTPRLIAKLGTTVVQGTDQTTQYAMRVGPGTFLSHNPKGQTIFGHPGLGAQLAFADPHTGLSFAFLTNFHTIHHFWSLPLILELQGAIYEGLEKKGK